MEKLKKLEKVEDFQHGDLVRVISYETNCGIDKGEFKALVIDSKEQGLLVVPENIEAHLLRAAEKGAYWEIGVEWLLWNAVDIYLIHRFDQLLKEIEKQ
ncbi:conjugal transfer protein TraF [Enterococcus hirae]|nr:conjugal transfer protein TraF [Enterococcus hirae]EMF0535600.1 conjugal transfer protein TraF [Enterococcus hirae]